MFYWKAPTVNKKKTLHPFICISMNIIFKNQASMTNPALTGF